MNTLKFITKAYESDPYIKAFLDNAAKDAQEKGTPLISALGAETTRVLGLMSAPTSAPQVATPAPAKRKPGPKPGTPRKAAEAPATAPVAAGAAKVVKVGRADVPTEATVVSKKKPGPKPGTPRKAKAKATAEGGKVRGLPVIAESEQTVSQG